MWSFLLWPDPVFSVFHSTTNNNSNTLTMSHEGAYQVRGKTRNAFDGNHANLNFMVINIKNGKLVGAGIYEESGVNKSSRWTGTVDAKGSVVFEEIYNGEDSYPYIYNGYIDGDNIWGTYRYTKHNNLGTFSFNLTSAPSVGTL